MFSNEIISGIYTGIISSIIFHPIDKIIFIYSLKNKSVFDWKKLYQGSLNTISTRIITSGLYYSYLDHYSNITNNKYKVALLTSFICSITSPIQYIKFNRWYNNLSTIETIKLIYNLNGLIGFTRGAIPLIIRDVIFNSIYLNYKQKNNHTMNLLVITSGIIIASPFNLIKNKQYATNESLKEIIKNFKFSQLGLGMTIIRNCLSFYCGQIIYDNCKKILV